MRLNNRYRIVLNRYGGLLNKLLGRRIFKFQRLEMLVGEGKALKRGLFVVFEGLDRSGKSTQSAKLAKYLKEEMQIPVKAINFPSK